MNVVLFRPIDGDPNVLVATLSGQRLSAAAIVTRTPAQDPSWPATWSYQIAGDITRQPSDPYTNEQAAVEAAANRLCDALHVGRLAWFVARDDDESVSHWGVGGTSATDPVMPIVLRVGQSGAARSAGDAVADAIRDGLLTPPRPNPTRVTEARPSLLSRLRGVWKAWRL